ncbi:class I SAM-dependent methyltransferase [Mycolicibacterium diernhoferi]|uniref:class I SAM-dependent methyltransferase n=1 Tax=Mycolicibacterium diernhoferi TaxID=1801 RepID=UPI001F2C61C0|nr:class I SAM-dependent methyltransferase [Mycolicibacterium diernhoferi]
MVADEHQSVSSEAAERRWSELLRRNVHRLSHVAGFLGAGQKPSRRLSDAQSYWSAEAAPGWTENSHWRSGLGETNWEDVGKEHLAMFEQFARALEVSTHPDVVIDWGCGGGANAVVFAPITKRKYIAADVSGESVMECVRQVRAVCDTPTGQSIIDIAEPGRTVEKLKTQCDLFLCTYVLELTADRDEALRILRLAERLLVSGGMAFIQVKYHTADWRTRGYKRNYRRNLSNMTTFGIEEFWIASAACGLMPKLITLVPRNSLDSRYAYYALVKP